MVWGDGADNLRPSHLTAAAAIDAAADGLQHHLTGMKHVALVPVVHGNRAKGPFHHHLAKAHRACLKGNVGNPVHSHAWGHLEPKASIARDGQKPLGDRAHIGSQLGLERV